MTTQDIYKLAEQLGEVLEERKLKLVTIESCTGGWLAEVITSIAGSSAYFEYGFVTYSNEAKTKLVGVDAKILQQHGAVSTATAQAMVEGGIKVSKADVGVAITGIAGPGGGTKQKPVGTVCFAFNVLNKPIVFETKHFSGGRNLVRQQAVEFALERLLQLLASQPKK